MLNSPITTTEARASLEDLLAPHLSLRLRRESSDNDLLAIAYLRLPRPIAEAHDRALNPPDRCEACGAERGDGYCQECGDDPDRIADARRAANDAAAARLHARRSGRAAEGGAVVTRLAYLPAAAWCAAALALVIGNVS